MTPAENQETISRYPSGLPRLGYNLRERKWKICFFWGMILLDSMIIPIILYFALWHGTGLSHDTVFTIISATIGGTAVLNAIQRSWNLWKKSSTCRIHGAKRLFFDSFHWIFLLSLLLVIILLSVGGNPGEPRARVLAIVAPTFLLTFSLQLLFIDTLRLFKFRAPFRISSVPRGGVIRPAIYSMIEDIVAVDGGGGSEFRERLNARYEASSRFREMLSCVSLLWDVPGFLVGVLTVGVVFGLDRNTAYVVGWSLPFIWASVWAAFTIQMVKVDLTQEEKAWDRMRMRHFYTTPVSYA